MQGGSPCAPFSLVSILQQKMNSSIRGVSTTKQSSLNPNAAEFVPSALRAAPGSANNTDVYKLEAAESFGKAVLNRTESANSSTSDDETRQYWRFRLPDDITPDFGQDALQESEGFLSGSLTGHDYTRASKSEGVMESGQLAFDKMGQSVDVSFPNGKSKFAFPQHVEGRSGSGMAPLSASSGWEQHMMGNDQQLVKNRDGYFSADECDVGFLNELVGEQALSDNGDINPVELLATEFPGFAAESLADIYYANGGDLSLTMEMLTQLEARQAYVSGNKALAKELSAKGQWHNGLMKAAHRKAGEAIYHQRNVGTTHIPNLIQGEDRLIDLHGLHVNEAIHVLKNELAGLRNKARSIGQRQQVLICVGTGHHTKGSRTPARLPAAVERYLLEDEHLDYTEPQPGMLRVSIY